MKITIASLIVLLLSVTSCSQNPKLFYEDAKTGKLYTASEYNDYKQKRSATLKHKNASLKEYIIEQYKRKDSTITVFKLNTITKSKVTLQNITQEKIFTLRGRELPNEFLKGLDGTYYDLGRQSKKPTFINIWYTTCKPCVAEIDFFNEIKKEYQDKINFIAITFESKDVVENFLKKKQFDFMHLVDAKKYLNEIGIKIYPKSIFINSSNIVTQVKGALIMNQANTEEHISEFKSNLEKLQ